MLATRELPAILAAILCSPEVARQPQHMLFPCCSQAHSKDCSWSPLLPLAIHCSLSLFGCCCCTLQALRAVVAYEERSAHQAILQTSRTPATAGAKQQPPQEASFDHWMEAYATFCFIMATARPSMAAVANTAADVMLQLQTELEARAEPFEPTAGCAR